MWPNPEFLTPEQCEALDVLLAEEELYEALRALEESDAAEER